MTSSRQRAGAMTLSDGDVLIVGHSNPAGGMPDPTGAETSAEIFRN